MRAESRSAATRLDYKLGASEDFVTRILHVDVTGEGWTRRIRLPTTGMAAGIPKSEAEGGEQVPPAGEPARPHPARP
jgi:hypothetical protein